MNSLRRCCGSFRSANINRGGRSAVTVRFREQEEPRVGPDVDHSREFPTAAKQR